MAKTSFKNAANGEICQENSAVEDIQGPVTDLSVQEHGETGMIPTPRLGEICGDVDTSDIVVPRLDMVQGVGVLSQNFTPGQVVLNKEVVLVEKDKPLYMTIIGVSKHWEEVVPFSEDDDAPRARVFRTAEDVHAAGLWTDWRNNQKPPVQPVAIVTTLIEQPEGVDSIHFPIDICGKAHVLARMTLKSTAYSRAAKQIFTARAFPLKESLLLGRWEFKATRSKVGVYVVTVPSLRVCGTNSPEIVAAITEAVG